MVEVVYWHGGIRGLKHGEMILPPSVTGSEHTLEKYGHELSVELQRPDRVYFTTNRNTARAYAALYPNGALYVVVPQGEVEEDPDNSVPGLSYMAPAAMIAGVYDPRVNIKPARALRYLLRGDS